MAHREWRKDFASRIADIDARSQSKHDETLKKAKKDLEKFYAEYEVKKKKMINKTRDAANEESPKGGSTWVRPHFLPHSMLVTSCTF